jgi:hypothetical protein
MANCIVEIGDESGNSFKVVVSTPFNGNSIGNWRTIDNGYIRFHSGYTRNLDSLGTLSTRHVQLYSGENTCGLRLNDFEDLIRVNKQGTGYLYPQWSLRCRPGRLSWVVVG